MIDQPNNTEGLITNLEKEFSGTVTVHTNLDQEVIITTKDKIKLALSETKDILESKRLWTTPLGTFLSLFVTLLTADFKEKSFGLTSSVWQAIFVISSIVSIGYLIKSLYLLYKFRDKGDIEEIIKQLKLKQRDKGTAPNNGLWQAGGTVRH